MFWCLVWHFLFIFYFCLSLTFSCTRFFAVYRLFIYLFLFCPFSGLFIYDFLFVSLKPRMFRMFQMFRMFYGFYLSICLLAFDALFDIWSVSHARKMCRKFVIWFTISVYSFLHLIYSAFMAREFTSNGIAANQTQNIWRWWWQQQQVHGNKSVCVCVCVHGKIVGWTRHSFVNLLLAVYVRPGERICTHSLNRRQYT